LASKIWQQHLVAESGHQRSLLYIDRVFLHERTGPAPSLSARTWAKRSISSSTAATPS
jgi:homoaconitase/3-isopropylmalate dehydratase large subunit